MGGPTANRQNAFTLGTAATEIYVVHGENATVYQYPMSTCPRHQLLPRFIRG